MKLKENSMNKLEEKQNIGNLKTKRGITLIALVITIIVLLILAGVTIATLTGENGILTKATEASDKTKEANAREQVQLAVTASIGTDGRINMDMLNNELKKIDNLTYKGSPISDSNKITSLPDTVNVDGIDVTINGEGSVSIGDNTGNTVEGVTIPDGFCYVGGTKDEGIVISDNAEDENKGTSWDVAKTLKGNQFVWVPVEDDSAFKTYEGYYDGDIASMLSNCEEPYQNGYADEASEYNAMKESVLENNGFYVGRYEAGTASAEGRTEESGITDDVVVKQGANVYNWIGWSNSRDMTVEIGGAVEKAKAFDTDNGYTSVTSTLIYGVQWDAIMQWIDPKYKNEDGTLTSFVANSTGKGNCYEDVNTNPWKGKLITTGASADYGVKNIYDLAGNVREWTMEAYDTNHRVFRGGNYSYTGSRSPASYRYDYSPSNSNDDFGFRLTLYL